MAEFKILVVEKLILMGNIAFNKLTHTNTNQTNGAYIRDGKPSYKCLLSWICRYWFRKKKIDKNIGSKFGSYLLVNKNMGF